MTPMPKVLIVEDDEVIAQGMARHLSAAGFDATWVGNGEQGLARLDREISRDEAKTLRARA